MATSPISSYSTTRIVGLSSGMDTDSIISNMMKIEQSKMDRLYQTNTKLTWKRDSYLEINKQLSAFRNQFMSATSVDNVFASSTYRAFKVNLADNRYLDVRATSNASASRHTITSATLAEFATISGEKYRNRAAQKDGIGKLNSYLEAKGSKKIDPSMLSEKLEDITDKEGNKLFDFTKEDKVSFSINGETFVLNKEQTLQDMMDRVNGNTKADVLMSLDSNGNILFTGKTKGPEAKMIVSNITSDNKLFGSGSVFGMGNVLSKNLLNAATTTLDELQTIAGRNFGFDALGQAQFKINGESFTIRKTDTVQSVLNQINSSAANVIASYDEVADTFSFRSKIEDSSSTIVFENIGTAEVFTEKGLFGIKAGNISSGADINRQTDTIATAAKKMGVDLQLDSDGMFSFIVNDVTFSFDASTSIQKMMDKVNGDKDANVTMSYSQITDSFVFSSKETGKDAKVEIKNKGANAFGANSFFGMNEGSAVGKNAIIKIDGETIERSSNSFVLDGMEITLKLAFEATTVNDEITFSIEQDVDNVVNKVKKFVEEYNKVVAMLDGLIAEDVDFDYTPLTEAQRKELSKEELEKWDQKAKAGNLRNDATISKLLSDMRSSLFEKVADTGLSPHDIGLSTGAWYNKGQITFDETKFRNALKESPDTVAKVMSGTSTAADKTTEYKESGLVTRFFNLMTRYENTVKDKNLKMTNKEISDNEKQMSNLLSKMAKKEEDYYLQFAMMEKLLTQYQAQSSWLTQQLSGAKQ